MEELFKKLFKAEIIDSGTRLYDAKQADQIIREHLKDKSKSSKQRAGDKLDKFIKEHSLPEIKLNRHQGNPIHCGDKEYCFAQECIDGEPCNLDIRLQV